MAPAARSWPASHDERARCEGDGEGEGESDGEGENEGESEGEGKGEGGRRLSLLHKLDGR